MIHQEREYSMAKKLIVIIGPNGVGKTTTASEFRNCCTNSAYIDAEWCRCINPFYPLTDATCELVINNMFCLLKNHLLCRDINTIVFPYGFHGGRKENFEIVIQRLQKEGIEFELQYIILKCSYDENVRRAKQDNRDEERVQRGMKNTFEFYDNYDYPVIDTTELEPRQVVQQMIKVLKL